MATKVEFTTVCGKLTQCLRSLGNCFWEFDSRLVSTLLKYESHIAGSRLVCMTKPTLGFSAEQLLQIAELEVDSAFRLL